MKITVHQGKLEKVSADLLVVNHFQGDKEIRGAAGAADRLLGGTITRLVRDGEITGKLGEAVVIHCHGKLLVKKIVVVGLGKKDKLDLDAVRTASAAAVKEARLVKTPRVATIIHGAGAGGLDPEEAAKALVEGAVLGLYTFSGYAKEQEGHPFSVKELLLLEVSSVKIGAVKRGAELGRIIAEAENHARDLVNTPANRLTPVRFARLALKIARENGLKYSSFDPQAFGMHALWAVAKGSDEPPRLVALEYRGAPASKQKIALIGKGITFDSGGISIKPSKKMDEMKSDMAGAAAVLGTMSLLSRLKPKKNVIGILPLTENMPSGHATKPGDVVGSLSGYTIEVTNTDAEGRMVIADAVTFAKKRGATEIIDIATLTGGCIAALGDAATGLMGNDEALLEKFRRLADRCGQKMWPLPIYDEYKEALKSDVADLKNTSGTGKAQPSSGAAFIAKFVGDTTWLHLDIAGTAFLDHGRGYLPKGATGVPVRALIEYLHAG